jgi:dCMP deaminase
MKKSGESLITITNLSLLVEMKQRFVNYYLDVAKRTAQLSHATKLKVGAVLVKNDNIISFSWNGTPRGWDNECEDRIWDRSWDVTNPLSTKEYPFVEYSDYEDYDGTVPIIGRYHLKTKSCVTHAEEAMLMKIASSHESAEGSSLFCTHSCCMNCAKLIYGAKISEFYYIEEYRSSEGVDFLKKCNIPVYKVEI